MFKDFDSLDLPKLEEKVLAFWRKDDTFNKSVAQRKGKKEFVFYEGPPYANGKPGIHHVLTRAFKDIVLRFKTMKGFFVPRRAGWDTHGLPTEIAIEKELGITHKKEIETFGIDLFNQKARESVWGFKEEWERLTERIGYWLDMKNAYITYTNDYMETMWWIFRRASERGFLKEKLKIVPYCSRCETPLASHELAMPGVYKKVKDPSVYVKFRIKPSDHRTSNSPRNEYLLVWTTTPWTLPANMFVAVNPEFTYTKYKVGKEFLWSYQVPPVRGNEEIEVVEKLSGKKLLGLEYEPLYHWKEAKKRSSIYRVVAADFVSGEEGTGLLHIAPAFGEEDFGLVAKMEGGVEHIPVTIDARAKVIAGYPGGGKYIKTADREIEADLSARNLLYLSESREHEYPFCWRCGTALVYFARTAWFFEMSRLRKELMMRNETINWIPAHIKEGRFGEWVKEAKDWAISRERYWGLPLPIWRCESCKAHEVVGSLAELDARDIHKNEFYLIRHTESDHNIKDIIASGPEHATHVSHLTKKGALDAERIAQKLSRTKFAAIYTSPYERTKKLAMLIGKATNSPVIVDKRLSEINCGTFNWRKVSEHKTFFANPEEEFVKTPPGGENLSDVKRRMFAAIREINEKHKGARIAMVSHGDPLWVLEGAMNNLTNKEMLEASYIRPGEVRKATLHNLPYNDMAELDMHRPYVDRVALSCTECKGGEMRRIKEVADVWFDSGAMPFAKEHFPFAQGKSFTKNQNLEIKNPKLSIPYPADYICEAIDQTRGWFYTLLAVATLLDVPAPYKNVICLGLVMDKFGQKMSKSKGNVVDPWMIAEKYGVDAARWYFYTANAPEESKHFDEGELGKAFRRFHLILYNSYLFYDTYAKKIPNLKNQISKNLLDRWIVARLHETIKGVTRELERYEIRNAALKLEEFTDDLSRWYIRRSRRRLQKPESKADFGAASATLGYVLREAAKLIAPFSPFFSEAMHQALGSKKIMSVHLENWPKFMEALIDDDLIAGMAEVRALATEGLALRAKAGIKVRQPLAAAKIKDKKLKLKNRDELAEILKEELNVKNVALLKNQEGAIVLDMVLTPELREEGMVREVVRMVAELRGKANYKPKDKIMLFLDVPEAMKMVIERHESFLKKESGSTKISYGHTKKFDAEFEGKFDEGTLWLAVKK